MNGEKLLTAMGLVDERFVAEAEEDRPGRVLPLPALRFAAGLAACFTVLVVWAVAVQCGKGAPNEAGTSLNSSSAAAIARDAETGGEAWLSEGAEAALEAAPEEEKEGGAAIAGGEAETAEEPEPMPTATPDSLFDAAGPTTGDGGPTDFSGAARFAPENVSALRTQSGPETEPWNAYDAGTAQKAAALVVKMLSGEAVEAPDGGDAPITLEFTLADGASRTFRLVTETVPGEAPDCLVAARAFLEDSGTWRAADFGTALELELLLGYAVE